MPPPRPKKRVEKKLGNEDGFFSDLPNRHRFTKVSRRTVNMLIKKQEREPIVFNVHLKAIGRNLNLDLNKISKKEEKQKNCYLNNRRKSRRMQDCQTLLILKIIVASQRYLPGGRMRIDGPGSSKIIHRYQ